MDEDSAELADKLFAELSEERATELLLKTLEEAGELASADRLEGRVELFRDDSAMADELAGMALLDATTSPGDVPPALWPAAELVVAVTILLKATSERLLAAVCALLARLDRRLEDDKGTGFCAVLLTECFTAALAGGEL